jgi:hypothetical protein
MVVPPNGAGIIGGQVLFQFREYGDQLSPTVGFNARASFVCDGAADCVYLRQQQPAHRRRQAEQTGTAIAGGGRSRDPPEAFKFG